MKGIQLSHAKTCISRALPFLFLVSINANTAWHKNVNDYSDKKLWIALLFGVISMSLDSKKGKKLMKSRIEHNRLIQNVLQTLDGIVHCRKAVKWQR